MNKKLLPIIICLTPLLLANAPAPDTKVSYEETFLLSKEEFTLSDNILRFNFTNSSKYYITSLKLDDNYIFDFYYFGMIIPPSKTTSIQVNNFVEKQIMKKYINPGIDQISSGFVNQSKIKNIFNTMHMTKVNSVQQNGLTSNLLARLKIQHELKSKAAVSQ